MSASSSIANAQQQSPKKNSLFRREALDHHLTRELEIDGQVLRVVPPWSWTLFWMLVAIVASTVVVSFVAEVELTSRGKGVLRAPGGVRTLQTQVGGVVTEVSAKSGQSVLVGEPLVKLESAGVQAALLEADRQLELVRSNLKSFTTKQEEIHRTRTALLRSHAELLKQRVASQENTIARLEAKVGSYNALNDKGMVGAIARDEVVEELDRARRQRIELDESLSQTSLELATLNSAHQSELWKAEQQIQEAETKRTALAFSLQQTLIQAPQDGYVEAVLVRAGDVITAGAPVGKLISTGAAKHVVAFLPEKDRAFVEIGSRVRLEVDQLPYSEF
ncbi:MAG TPA: HlyD family efflux transporter periplasmic adaptor subunit, partial [Polyangiaceae bacterium]|nr:HlyD family efflux transporter periplasmic adaptor subunit [Polyangiaceae bacterium]